MSISKALVGVLGTPAVVFFSIASSQAAPLPTNIATMKAAAVGDLLEVRWGGWHGGWHGGWVGRGWGYRGWGYRPWGWGALAAGAIIGGALASSAYYDGYPHYGGYAYEGCSPYYGGYGGCYPYPQSYPYYGYRYHYYGW
jgi:hypothetical protein